MLVRGQPRKSGGFSGNSRLGSPRERCPIAADASAAITATPGSRARASYRNTHVPGERAGLCPASESRNPVINAVCAFTPAMTESPKKCAALFGCPDYWIPARARPHQAASLGGVDIGEWGEINLISPVTRF